MLDHRIHLPRTLPELTMVFSDKVKIEYTLDGTICSQKGIFVLREL